MRKGRTSAGDPPPGSHLDVIFEASPALTVSAYRNVLIADWREAPTVAALLRVDDYTAELYERYHAVAAVVVVDSRSLLPPDGAARAEHARLTRKYETNSVGMAMIIEGRSPKHAAIRFVLTTLQLMSSPRVPQRICRSTAEAAKWLSGLGAGYASSELLAAIQATRRIDPAGVWQARNAR